MTQAPAAEPVPNPPGQPAVGGPVRVSVVVPVYNPGRSLDTCLESLIAQTLPAAERELIFVDDGSTDGSLERLQGLAREHPDVRVIPIPRSGWPGKPRNVGTDAARGEYVMYVDQDDALGLDALRRMYRMGAAHQADLVLGKVVSDFRGVHHNLYRINRARCTIWNAPLINAQTPHKMLRRAFLVARGIRYPEGPRRLEDQLFITTAYFAASSASIVGDYVCYRYLRRADGDNAGSALPDPPAYYANLREVLDVVDRYTEPGPARDGFYRRFVRTEMLGRLGGRKLIAAPDEHRREVVQEVRALLRERVPLTVDAGLGAALRVRAELARAGREADLVRLAGEVSELTLDVRLRGVRVLPGPAYGLDVVAGLRYRGEPLALQPGTGGRWLLPRALVGPAASDEQRTVEPVEELTGDLVISHRELLDEWFLPSPLSVGLDQHAGTLRWTGTVILDPTRAAGGRPLHPGRHDLTARVEAFGLVRNAPVREGGFAPLPLLIAGRGRVHRTLTRSGGQLVLEVKSKRSRLLEALRETQVRVVLDRAVTVALPAVWDPGPSVHLLLSAEGGADYATSLHRPDPESSVWAAPDPWAAQLPPGTYRAVLQLSVPPHHVELDSPLVVPRSSPTFSTWSTGLRSGARAAVRAVVTSAALRGGLRRLPPGRDSRPAGRE